MKALRTVLFAVTLPLIAITFGAFIATTNEPGSRQGAGIGIILVVLLAVLLVLAEMEQKES